MPFTWAFCAPAGCRGWAAPVCSPRIPSGWWTISSRSQQRDGGTCVSPHSKPDLDRRPSCAYPMRRAAAYCQTTIACPVACISA
jgi:hypothetical protein